MRTINPITILSFLILGLLTICIFQWINIRQCQKQTNSVRQRYSTIIENKQSLRFHETLMNGSKLDKNWKIISATGQISSINDIIKNDCIVIFLDQSHCSTCYKKILDRISKKDFQPFLKNTVIISNFVDFRSLIISLKTEKVPVKVYNSVNKPDNIEMFSVGLPIIFHISEDLTIISSYIFQKEISKELDYFVDAVKKIFSRLELQ